MSDTWNLKEAKNRLGDLVDRVLKEGPQVVSRDGKKVVVVLSYDEYERMTRTDGSLVDFLLSPPWAGSELTVERDRSFPRDTNLEQ